MTANYKYSRSNGESLQLPIQIKLSEKPSTFFDIFLPFFESTLNLQCLKRKKRASSLKYFSSYWIRKMCLFNCITGIVSESPLVVNMLMSLENSWNLQKSTFILFFLHSVPNWVRKIYFSLDLWFYAWFITRWLPTTSILVVIERIYSYQFKSNYLRHHQFFKKIFYHFWNLY